MSPREHLGTAATHAIAAWARRCRADVNDFIEGVMLDGSGAPIVQATIHRVMHLHFEHCWRVGRYPSLLAPFAHGKTVQTIGRVGYETGRAEGSSRIKIVCNSDDKAMERVMGVTQLISTPRYKLAFPEVRPVPREKARELKIPSKWTQHEIYLDRPGHAIDPSIQAAAVLATGIGGRADFILFDDVVDRRNALDNPELRAKVLGSIEDVWMSRLEPGGRVAYIGTAWHMADATHALMQKPGWCTLVIAVSEDFKRLDMEVFNPDPAYPLPMLHQVQAGWEEIRESSNLEAVRHRGADLEVRFRGGRIYRYMGVPSGVAQVIRDAPSPGGAFAKLIRGRYPEERIR